MKIRPAVLLISIVLGSFFAGPSALAQSTLATVGAGGVFPARSNVPFTATITTDSNDLWNDRTASGPDCAAYSVVNQGSMTIE